MGDGLAEVDQQCGPLGLQIYLCYISLLGDYKERVYTPTPPPKCLKTSVNSKLGFEMLVNQMIYKSYQMFGIR